MNLTSRGAKTPTLPTAIKMHKYLALNPKLETQTSLSYQNITETNAQLRDALRYIMREAEQSIKDTKQLGTAMHNTTSWTIICEIQASQERIRDNCEIALTYTQ